MSVVKIERVTRDYTVGEVTTKALRGVDLEIEEGEFVALVGPSGSGKTTLLQLIGCLDQPTSGTVHVNGKDVSRLSRDERAEIRQQEIGFIFQFFALIPTLSAYENIEMPLLLNKVNNGHRQQRVTELLEAVELGEHAHKRPDQLSGGQQQRVSVARALASNPRLIIADEPTASLDTTNGDQVMEIMTRLNQETGVTFIFASHDPRAIKFARRVVRLEDGHVISDEQQTPAQV